MTTLDAIEAFEAILDDDPQDWDTRLRLADALDEVGETVRGNGQRWMGVHRKRAYQPPIGVPAHCWYDDSRTYPVRDPESDIPLRVLRSMVGGGCDDQLQKYATRLAAELALAHALDALSIVAEVPR